MNQILFLENKNKIKKWFQGSRQANEKRVEGLNKEFFEILIFEIAICFLGSLQVE